MPKVPCAAGAIQASNKTLQYSFAMFAPTFLRLWMKAVLHLGIQIVNLYPYVLNTREIYPTSVHIIGSYRPEYQTQIPDHLLTKNRHVIRMKKDVRMQVESQIPKTNK